MATKADLAQAVLEDLGVIAASETPSASDQTLIIQRYEREYSLLLNKQLAWWSKDAIPDEAMGPLTQLVAYRAAPSFGQLRNMADHQHATRDLSRLYAKADMKSPAKAEYY